MQININDYVRVTKVGIAESPLHKTALAEEWAAGELNSGLVPPVEYTVEGTVLAEMETGKAFLLFRTKRNGVEVDGYFRTSLIAKIENTDYGCNIFTDNSVYKIEKIEKE